MIDIFLKTNGTNLIMCLKHLPHSLFLSKQTVGFQIPHPLQPCGIQVCCSYEPLREMRW